MPVTASENGRGSVAEQLIDNGTSPSKKWFTLFDNKLDGSYHALPNNNVAYFDGTVDSYIRGGVSPSFNGDKLTVEAWVKSRDVSMNQTVASRNGPFFLRISGGKIRIAVYTNSSWVFAGGSIPLQDNVWHHLALVYDGTHAKGYVDGVLDVNEAKSGTLTSTVDYINLGFPASVGENYPFYGDMSEVRLWKAARTQTEIVENMHSYLSGSETDLVAYYKLDESDDAVAYDSSVNGNDKTKTNISHNIDNPVMQVGWWGESLSDASGEIPAVTITVTGLMEVNALTLVGNELTGNYPVDFTVTLYDEATEIYSDTVVGNTDNVWLHRFTSLESATKAVFQITKISKANQPAVLMESNESFNLIRSSDLNISDYAVTLVGVGISSNDILSLSDTTQSDGVTAKLDSNDTLSLSSNDSSFFRQYEFKSDDVLSINIDNESIPIVNSFTKADTLKITDSGDIDITVQLDSDDVLSIKPDVEADEITVDLNSSDTLSYNMIENPTMENVHTIMNGYNRQVFARVEITYTDPFSDETVTYTASDTGRFTSAEQLSDRITDPKYKWFSLHDNTLDGSYHALPSNNEYSVGWWGTKLSGADGYLVTPPVVTITFAARALTNLRLVGDSKLNSFPVDFEMNAYDASDTLLATKSVVDNTEVDWLEPLDPFIPGVVKLTVTITKINKPYEVVKLTELFTAIKETYYADDLETIGILEESGYNTGALPIGNISANEADISVSNADRRFDLDNDQSPLYGYVKRNRRVNISFGVEIGGVMEWYPAGVYWTTTWDISKDSMVARLTARDRLELLRITDFTSSSVYTDYSLYDLFELILVDAGLSSDEYELDSSLEDITIPYAWFMKMSHREALQRIAGCAIVQVYCTKEGKIKVNLDLDATDTVITSYDEDVNIYSSSFPIAVSEQVNYVGVTSKQWREGDTEQLYESTEILNIGASGVLSKTYEFDSTPAVSMEAPVLVGDPDITVTDYTLYAWGADVTFTNSAASEKTITSVVINGKLLESYGKQVAVAKDEALIRDNGKMKADLEHDFIQSFSYAESLSSTILETYKESKNDATVDCKGDIAIRLGDKVTIIDETPYTVYRRNVTWAGYLGVVMQGKKL